MTNAIQNYTGGKKYKVPGLGLQIDVVMWIIVVLIIVAIVLGVGYHLRESARIACITSPKAGVEGHFAASVGRSSKTPSRSDTTP